MGKLKTPRTIGGATSPAYIQTFQYPQKDFRVQLAHPMLEGNTCQLKPLSFKWFTALAYVYMLINNKWFIFYLLIGVVLPMYNYMYTVVCLLLISY